MSDHWEWSVKADVTRDGPLATITVSVGYPSSIVTLKDTIHIIADARFQIQETMMLLIRDAIEHAVADEKREAAQ